MDTEENGTRTFHQVKPSGHEGCRMILKLVPGQSVQPLSLINSSVHVASTPSPQSSALTVSPSTTCRGHSVSPEAQIQQPFSHSASIKAFLPSPITAVIPETLIQAAQPKSHSKKAVLVANANQCLIVKPYGPVEVTLDAISTQEEDTIKKFSKISCFSPKPNSPHQRIIEDSEQSQNQSSGKDRWNKNCLVVHAEGDETSLVEKQPEFPVVMFDDKIFFQVKKTVSQEGEVIDLCLDEISNVPNVGTPTEVHCADEDCVTFVSYTPAPEESRAEDRTGTKTGPAPEDNNTTLTDCTQAVFSHRESHTPQPQISSGSSAALCPVADHKLKQMFGITSDVEIRLPRLVSSDTEIPAAVMKVPTLDYTEPIEEDFLCPGPPHSQDCPQVEGSASRVGRTRKRTKCSCCSPAILHLYQKGRPKTVHNEKRETARRQLKLQPPPVSSSVTSAATTSATTCQAAPKLPKLQPTEVTVPETSATTISETAPLTTLLVPKKKVKLKPPSVNTSITNLQISRKKVKLKPPSLPTSQISRKKVKLKPPSANDLQIPRKRVKVKLPPVTVPPLVTPSQVPQKQNNLPETSESIPTTITVTTLQIQPPNTPSIVPLPGPLTSPVISQRTTLEADSEEVQIHKEIEQLREALRLKEAALQKLKSDRNR